MTIDSIAPDLAIKPLKPLLRHDEGAAMPIPGVDAGTDALNGAEGAAKSFGGFLQKAIGDVNDAQLRAGEITNKFAAGGNVDIHQVMIAGQEAGVMLNLAVQVRNKLVEAYQEVMRVNM